MSKGNEAQLDWTIYFATNGVVLLEPIQEPPVVSVHPYDVNDGSRLFFEHIGRQIRNAINDSFRDINGFKIKVTIEPIEKELEYGK